MWTVVIEVTLVGNQYSAGVTLVVDQDPVGALGTDATNEPFRVAVRSRRLRGSPDRVDAFCGEHRVEGTGELGVSIADQKPEGRRSVAEIHDEVAGLLGRPGAIGVSVTPKTRR